MKKRKGMTIIEVVIALLLMGLAFIVIGRLTGSRIAQTEALKYQENMRAADGFLYNIYQDYHQCVDYEVVTSDNTVNGLQVLSTELRFNLGTEGVHIYEYRRERQESALVAGEYIEKRACYYNNIESFECNAFDINPNDSFLFVSIQLDNGQRLECTIYR